MTPCEVQLVVSPMQLLKLALLAGGSLGIMLVVASAVFLAFVVVVDSVVVVKRWLRAWIEV